MRTGVLGEPHPDHPAARLGHCSRNRRVARGGRGGVDPPCGERRVERNGGPDSAVHGRGRLSVSAQGVCSCPVTFQQMLTCTPPEPTRSAPSSSPSRPCTVSASPSPSERSTPLASRATRSASSPSRPRPTPTSRPCASPTRKRPARSTSRSRTPTGSGPRSCSRMTRTRTGSARPRSSRTESGWCLRATSWARCSARGRSSGTARRVLRSVRRARALHHGTRIR